MHSTFSCWYKHARRRLGDERGATLLFGMAVITGIMIVAAAMVDLSRSSVRSAVYWVDKSAAFFAAESGIEMALFQLNASSVAARTYPSDPPSLESSEGLLGADTSFAVWVEPMESGSRRIVSRGTVRGRSKVVELRIGAPGAVAQAIIETTPGRPYYEPTFTPVEKEISVAMPDIPGGLGPGGDLHLEHQEELELGPGSYRYASIHLEHQSTLTLNGPITLYVEESLHLENNTALIVNGTANFYVYDDFELENNSSATFNGATSIHVGDRFQLENNAAFVASGQLALCVVGNLQLENNGPLNLQQRTVVTVLGNLTFENNTGINNAEVAVFYVAGSITAKNNAQLGQEPERLLLYARPPDGSGQSVQLENNAEVQGVVYAPWADVRMKNNAEVTGAVVASTFQGENNWSVNYAPVIAETVFPGSWAITAGTWGELQ